MPTKPEPDLLPPGLPVPLDDGTAHRLTGLSLPPLQFTSSDGASMRLDRVTDGPWVLFIYPTTGDPDAAMPDGWDLIPGARGCSQEACSFRDNLSELKTLGVHRLYGLSSDMPEHQTSLIERFHLEYPLISDPGLTLAKIMEVPTFSSEGKRYYGRLTMAVRGAKVEHVFCPITSPAVHADEVVDWYRSNHK